jgi:hypothetical protein
MAGVSLDAASSEDLCLGEPGLFVGLIFKNLDVSLGLDDSTTSSNKSLVLKQRVSESSSSHKLSTYSFPFCEFSGMNFSTGSIEGRVSHPGTSKESGTGASGGGSFSNGGVAASAVGKVSEGRGITPA